MRTKGNKGEEKVLLLRKLKVRTTPILSLPNLHLKRRMVQKIEIVTLRG